MKLSPVGTAELQTWTAHEVLGKRLSNEGHGFSRAYPGLRPGLSSASSAVPAGLILQSVLICGPAKTVL
jgi:hypothetical protein